MSRAWWQNEDPDPSEYADDQDTPLADNPLPNGWGDPDALADFNQQEPPL